MPSLSVQDDSLAVSKMTIDDRGTLLAEVSMTTESGAVVICRAEIGTRTSAALEKLYAAILADAKEQLGISPATQAASTLETLNMSRR